MDHTMGGVTADSMSRCNFLEGHYKIIELGCLCSNLPPVKEYFGKGGEAMSAKELESEGMVHVKQLTYKLKCNWKVCMPLLAFPSASLLPPFANFSKAELAECA